MNWSPEPLWQLFEREGIDVATMQPVEPPLQGPRLDFRAHVALLQIKKIEADMRSHHGRWQAIRRRARH
jgi:hypothetical protein